VADTGQVPGAEIAVVNLENPLPQSEICSSMASSDHIAYIL